MELLFGILFVLLFSFAFFGRRKAKKETTNFTIKATFDDMGNDERMAANEERRHAELLQIIQEMETVYLDIETTGLDYTNDEVLEISIIDNKGEILINTLVRPIERKRWPKAQEIHGISYSMVKDSPTLDELKPKIRAAVKNKHIVIYNKHFDMRFLPFLKSHPSKHISCCMERFSRYKHPGIYGRPEFKLVDAAAEAGYQWEGVVHRSLADALATRHVWLWLDEQNAILV